MGTNHLICIFKNGEYKVAQYGQWDGYPSGQGVDILNFLSDPKNISSLLKKLDKVRFLDDIKDKVFMDSYNKNAPEWSSEPDNRTPEQKHWFKSYISRDLGADILRSIRDSNDNEILLKNSLSFASESLFCEYAYVVDFDKNTFEVYEGFNKKPVDKSERFADIKGHKDNGYYPVTLKKSYSLDSLPTEKAFLSDLVNEEEE